MNSAVSFICAVVVLVAVIQNVEADAEGKTCKQILSDLTKRQLQGMGKCTKTMKFKNGKDKAAKTMCIMKCVMSNEGILSPTGHMDRETFEKFIKKELSESLRERGVQLLGRCQEQHAPNLDPDEEFCKSYDPLVKCFLGAVLQLCPSS